MRTLNANTGLAISLARLSFPCINPRAQSNRNIVNYLSAISPTIRVDSLCLVEMDSACSSASTLVQCMLFHFRPSSTTLLRITALNRSPTSTIGWRLTSRYKSESCFINGKKYSKTPVPHKHEYVQYVCILHQPNIDIKFNMYVS